MNQRLPFYMVYNTESMMRDWKAWDEEQLSRRDYEYMKSTYPEMAKRIMPYVEEECDRMEYSGSMMFDEYPDQLQLRMMCRRIYAKVKGDMHKAGGANERKNDEKRESDQWLMDLIWVITWQEILKRREEYRKYRKKFY